jgi:uncharacterized protein (DUF58 family)
MDATAPLRRTVRRCTAALIAALGIATYALGSGSGLGLGLALAGLCYLAASLVYAPTWTVEDRPVEE